MFRSGAVGTPHLLLRHQARPSHGALRGRGTQGAAGIRGHVATVRRCIPRAIIRDAPVQRTPCSTAPTAISTFEDTFRDRIHNFVVQVDRGDRPDDDRRIGPSGPRGAEGDPRGDPVAGHRNHRILGRDVPRGRGRSRTRFCEGRAREIWRTRTLQNRPIYRAAEIPQIVALKTAHESVTNHDHDLFRAGIHLRRLLPARHVEPDDAAHGGRFVHHSSGQDAPVHVQPGHQALQLHVLPRRRFRAPSGKSSSRFRG